MGTAPDVQPIRGAFDYTTAYGWGQGGAGVSPFQQVK